MLTNTLKSRSSIWARKMERQQIIQVLADAIYAGFVKGDGGEWLSKTGRLVSHPSLRVQKTKHSFAVVREAVKDVDQKRFWTKACLREALVVMMKQRSLEVPKTSGFSWSTWLKDEVSSLHTLAQKARKNHWRIMAEQDSAPTLQYDIQGDLQNSLEEPAGCWCWGPGSFCNCFAALSQQLLYSPSIARPTQL